jgi:hypothetical protein
MRDDGELEMMKVRELMEMMDGNDRRRALIEKSWRWCRV